MDEFANRRDTEKNAISRNDKRNPLKKKSREFLRATPAATDPGTASQAAHIKGLRKSRRSWPIHDPRRGADRSVANAKRSGCSVLQSEPLYGLVSMPMFLRLQTPSGSYHNSVSR